MKLVYWRPQKVSCGVVLAVGALALAGLALVESFPSRQAQPHLFEKIAAAKLAEECMRTIKEERVRRGTRLNPRHDPTGSGMIGTPMSLVTSLPAHLHDKQIAVNPNFAAVFVELLKKAGVREGDVVAVGWTGSFPGFNVSLCAALETLNVRPVIIASAMASQFGANDADFMWVDMETVLAERGLISFRSAAASIGGPADRGYGMSPEAVRAAQAAIDRNQIAKLQARTLRESVDARMAIYDRVLGDRPLAAYVNVGGGVASTGAAADKSQLRAGLNTQLDDPQVNSVSGRFIMRGIPVIHLAEVSTLAGQFGLSRDGAVTEMAGVGAVFHKIGPNRWLAAVVLVLIVAVLRAFVLTDLGYQLCQQLPWRRARTSATRVRVVGSSAGGPQLMA
jgi:poly-gamma-glutamate system protein